MRRFAKVLLALTSGIVALLLAEAVARVFFEPPRYHNEPLELDGQLGFRGIPDFSRDSVDERGRFSFRLNGDGLRSPELPAATDAGDAALRVAFVGDSFLVGEGVRSEELLTSRVAARLAERGTEVRIHNLSAPDYGTAQELLLLRRFAARIAPQLVVLAFYPGNDLINNFEGLAERTQVSPGDFLRPYLVPEGDALRVHYLHPVRARLRRHAQLYAQVERRLVGLALARGWSWLHRMPQTQPPLERLRAGSTPLEPLEIFRQHEPDHLWERAWRRSFALLAAMRRECDAIGARLIVAVIPHAHQVRWDAEAVPLDVMTRALRGVPLDRSLDWNLPERRLARFFEQEGIESLLLLPLLRSAAQRAPGVYAKDGHLGAAGHAVAAAALARAILGDAPAAPITGGPVRALPEADRSPRVLDLRDAAHRRHLGASWVPWQPTPEKPIRGARFGRRAYVALRDAPGDLVVRGLAPASSTYPAQLEIQIIGAPRQLHRIEKPGPFTLRLPRGAARLPTADGYVALIFDRLGGAADGGVVVQRIGFEAD